jgi:hypothetical protein
MALEQTRPAPRPGPAETTANDVTSWLLDSDPAIRWQVLRDLKDATAPEVAAERADVADAGWGKRLLDLQANGQWAGGACFPGRDWRAPHPIAGDPNGQPWTATLPTLRLLRDLGIDPADPGVRAAVNGVREHCRWEYAGEPFFDGEVEPCINGGTVAIGAYFGQQVDGIVSRLLGEQLADGGWNCEAENGSTRSSFHTTMCVLDGLLEYERAGGTIPVTDPRRRGEEYLLTRNLFRRASTGQVADPDFLRFSFPTQWHYDVLRALDYFRAVSDAAAKQGRRDGVAGPVSGAPDPRLAEAVQQVRRKRQPDGRWLLENTHPGLVHFELEDGDGKPSRWNTLRALRVLRWYDAA